MADGMERADEVQNLTPEDVARGRFRLERPLFLDQLDEAVDGIERELHARDLSEHMFALQTVRGGRRGARCAPTPTFR